MSVVRGADGKLYSIKDGKLDVIPEAASRVSVARGRNVANTVIEVGAAFFCCASR